MPNPSEPDEQVELSGAQPELADELYRAPAAHGEPGQKPKRNAVLFILFTISLDMLAMGMVIPVLPRLFESLMHAPPGDAAAQASRMLGIFGTLFAAIQFFASPVIGSLSDRFGRRPVVLLSNFGLGLDYLLMAWAPSIGWLLIGRTISGLTASSIPTAQAYIADVTPKEKRAGAFGILSAAFAIGFVLGPAIGGVLGDINPRAPFWVSACLSLLNGMYGFFVLPESLKPENRSPFAWKRANPIGSLRMLNRSRVLLGLGAVLLAAYIAQQSLMNVYVLYADYRFHWSDRAVGLSLGLVGIVSGMYGGGLVKHLVKAISERGAILFGLFFGMIGFALFGFSKTGTLLLWAIPVMNCMSFAWPSAQSLMTQYAGANEQGQLQGAIQSLRGLSGLVGPGLFTWIFAQSVGLHPTVHLPGSPFFLASLLLLVALIMAFFLAPRCEPGTSERTA